MGRRDHWTARYVCNRLAEVLYQRSFPNDPWLTRSANSALASLLRPTDIGLEFGSGRSTAWFASRIGFLTSVEHNANWHREVSDRISKLGIGNVNYLFRAAGAEESSGTANPYIAVASSFADASLDFILVDGAHRGWCAKGSLPKLRKNGLLVIDNVNWFLPSNSRSPNSRAMSQGPYDET